MLAEMRPCVCLALILVLLPAGKNHNRQIQMCSVYSRSVGLCQCSGFSPVCSLLPKVLHLLGCKSWEL